MFLQSYIKITNVRLREILYVFLVTLTTIRLAILSSYFAK